MLVRPIYQESETWKKLAILALALALGVALVSAVGADRSNPERAPGLLPPEIKEWATPMPNEISVIIPDAEDLGCQIWQILELHRIRNHEAAITAWNEVNLPSETGVWKWIALGQASIAAERLDEAEEYLDRAIQSQPNNAVSFYFRGVLRLYQAQFAWDWPEDFAVPGTRLVALAPRRVVPNTKAMYELAATVDFEKAIELARNFQPDEPIISDGFPSRTALEPTAGDLLLALDSEKFEGKAHNTLGCLFLKRGSLELAERHLDDAVQSGLGVVYGYRDLGDEYRACGRHADAMRAYLKATKFSASKMSTLLDAIRCLGDVVNEQ